MCDNAKVFSTVCRSHEIWNAYNMANIRLIGSNWKTDAFVGRSLSYAFHR